MPQAGAVPDAGFTPLLTYYTVHTKRGDEAMLDAGVLPNCHGWAVHDGFKPYFGFETVRHAFEAAYEAVLAEGFAAYPIQPRPPNSTKRVAQHPATHLLIRLRDYRDAVLAFMRYPQVPFDNNLAERDLRMMKVKQKISGGFRTWAGAELFAAIRTYLSTARKQGVSMLHAAQLAFLGTPFIPAIPE